MLKEIFISLFGVNVFFLLFFFIFLLLIVVLVFWLIFSFSKFFNFDREKSSGFECGFDFKDRVRSVFSLRFFLVVILFIIFDIELCFILKIPFEGLIKNYYEKYFIFFLFVIIVLLGTLEEWRRGLLFWKFS